MAKKKISRKVFDKELKRLQTELCALQDWVVRKGLKVAVVFEGRDAAVKGSYSSNRILFIGLNYGW